MRRGYLWLALALGASFAVQADEVLLYRYVDNKGVTVLDRQGVPPEYIGKGYQVLNQRGRVIQTVAPALTAEQVQQKQAEKAQADANAQLLQRYSSVDEVDKALGRKLAELDGLIASVQTNLQALLAQQAGLQGQAAEQERAGKEVSSQLLAQLAGLRDEQVRMKADIAKYQAARSQSQQDFAVDRARVEQLLR
ncbi:DUF4124 domain-containing protein [Pseudomonas gingeri]|uniref:DUF4124 domain-containing protein n=1 Tax=Pseudomonas gingeri TaxID=117681 RepID=UPI0015A43FA9|nr:DUF4124 domain-containing protein [Pseudomonas gingeri]NWE24436.1 DUF4124 domain-containing protein [Pseudomonas gingeri]NWE97825.1 DUF4124 domain-containing protein [Pseudomonas gingeri]